MPDCAEVQVLNALDAKLRTLSWVKFLTSDKIKLGADDFLEHELPAIQIYADGGTVIQSSGRTQNSWFITTEIIIKPTAEGYADSRTLLNYMDEVRRKIGEDPTLSHIAGLIHIQYNNYQNDLHILGPLYLCKISWEAIFMATYNTGC